MSILRSGEKVILITIVLLLPLIVPYPKAQAQATTNASTVTWTGKSGDGKWETPTNWSTGSVPGLNDLVTIIGSVTLSSTANIAVLILSASVKTGNSTLECTAGCNLTVNAEGVAFFGWIEDSFDPHPGLRHLCIIDVTSGGIITNRGFITLSKFSGGVVNDTSGGVIINYGFIEGLVNIAGGKINDFGTIRLESGNPLINDGVITIYNSGTLTDSLATLANSGNIINSGVISNYSGEIVNNGTIENKSHGVIQIEGGAIDNRYGTITNHCGATISGYEGALFGNPIIWMQC